MSNCDQKNDGTTSIRNPNNLGVNIDILRKCVRCNNALEGNNQDFVKCVAEDENGKFFNQHSFLLSCVFKHLLLTAQKNPE